MKNKLDDEDIIKHFCYLSKEDLGYYKGVIDALLLNTKVEQEEEQ